MVRAAPAASGHKSLRLAAAGRFYAGVAESVYERIGWAYSAEGTCHVATGSSSW